jgi:hypothetical protein
MKVRVESQDRQLLKQLQAAFGGSVSRSRGSYERQWSCRVMYALTISGTPARQMVTRVLPHMKNPRRREVAEAWLSSRTRQTSITIIALEKLSVAAQHQAA